MQRCMKQGLQRHFRNQLAHPAAVYLQLSLDSNPLLAPVQVGSRETILSTIFKTTPQATPRAGRCLQHKFAISAIILIRHNNVAEPAGCGQTLTYQIRLFDLPLSQDILHQTSEELLLPVVLFSRSFTNPHNNTVCAGCEGYSQIVQLNLTESTDNLTKSIISNLQTNKQTNKQQ